MKQKFRIFVIFSVFSSSSCEKRGPIEPQTLKIVRKSDSIVRFESATIQKVIVDRYGGMVVPLELSEQDALKEATSLEEDNGKMMEIFLGNDLLYEMNTYPGIGLGFIYVRGNYDQKIGELKAAGVKIMEVDEIPMSSSEVRKLSN